MLKVFTDNARAMRFTGSNSLLDDHSARVGR